MTKPKVEHVQQWMVQRNDGRLFIISTLYKKTSWLGIDAAFFNSKASFFCIEIIKSKRLMDQISGTKGFKVEVVFIKWDDSTAERGRSNATDYSIRTEEGEELFNGSNSKVLLEI